MSQNNRHVVPGNHPEKLAWSNCQYLRDKTFQNPSHKMLMSVLGGMSESERQHIQARVRAAMDSHVLNEGRHQGGRAPCGYVTVDDGAPPNPRKAPHEQVGSREEGEHADLALLSGDPRQIPSRRDPCGRTRRRPAVDPSFRVSDIQNVDYSSP